MAVSVLFVGLPLTDVISLSSAHLEVKMLVKNITITRTFIQLF